MKLNPKCSLVAALFSIALFCAYSRSQTVGSSEQDTLKKFEISGQVHGFFVNSMDASDEVFKRNGFPDRALNDKFIDVGVGGRFTYNLDKRLAIETEVNYFPGDPTLNELASSGRDTNVAFSGGKKIQLLGGAKYGYRRDKYGVFGKFRSGIIRYGAYPRLTNVIIIPSTTGGPPEDVITLANEKAATFLNFDVGAVFEYYPSKNTIIRIDVGDTIIRYNAQKPKQVNPSFLRHNLQTSIGFGFRF